MTDSWTIRLGNYTTPPLTSNQRLHWRSEYAIKKALRQAVTLAAQAQSIPHLESAHIVLVYTPRDKRRRDSHNLVPSVKVGVDALVTLGILVDDTPEYLSESMPIIAEPDRNDPHLRLEITRGKRPNDGLS